MGTDGMHPASETTSHMHVYILAFLVQVGAQVMLLANIDSAKTREELELDGGLGP
jgi:hypothetical protein